MSSNFTIDWLKTTIDKLTEENASLRLVVQQLKKSVEFISDIFDAKVKAMEQTKTESERPHLRFNDFEGEGNAVTWVDTQAKLKAFLRR